MNFSPSHDRHFTSTVSDDSSVVDNGQSKCPSWDVRDSQNVLREGDGGCGRCVVGDINDARGMMGNEPLFNARRLG